MSAPKITRKTCFLPAKAVALCASRIDDSYYVCCANHVIYKVERIASEVPGKGKVLSIKLSHFAGSLDQKGDALGHRIETAQFDFSSRCGICMSTNGDLFVTQPQQRLVKRIDAKDGSVSVYTQSSFAPGSPVHICFAASTGTFYAIDGKRILRIEDGAQVTAIPVHYADADFTHISLSFDESKLLLCCPHSLFIVPTKDFKSHLDSRVQTGVGMAGLPNGEFLSLVDDSLAYYPISTDSMAWRRPNMIDLKVRPVGTSSNTSGQTLALHHIRREVAVTFSYDRTVLLLLDISTFPFWTVDEASSSKLASMAQFRTLRVDLGALRSPECLPRLICDEITNDYSGHTYSLHPILFSAYNIRKDVFIDLVKTAKFPHESLEFFFNTLYSDLNVLGDITNGTKSALSDTPATNGHRLTHLEKAVHLAACYVLYYSLFSLIASEPIKKSLLTLVNILTGEERAKLLVTHFMVAGGRFESIGLIAPYMKICEDDFVKSAPLWIEAMKQDPTGVFEVNRRVHTQTDKKEPASEFRWWDRVVEGEVPKPSQLTSHVWALGELVDWKPSSSQLFGHPPLSYEYRLSIAGFDQVLDVSEFVLFGSWSFFRRMMCSGLGESSTRICEFPDDFPPQLLLAIVKCLHGLSKHLASNLLPKADCIYALSRAVEFGLVDWQPPHAPVHPFGPLIEVCRGSVLAPLSPYTVMDNIVALSYMDDEKTEMDRNINYALKLSPAERSKGRWETYIDQLPEDILKRLGYDLDA